MSANTIVPQPPTEPSTNAMPAGIQNPPRDPLSAIPPFSYAQAAKGRAPTASSNVSSSDDASTTKGIDLKRTLSSDQGSSPDIMKEATKRTASEGRMPEGRNAIEPAAASSLQPDDRQKEPISEDMSAHAGAQVANSVPSSPDYGTTSTSTLLKEEDTSSTANGSSESTWDKQSQSSHTGTTTVDKVGVDQKSPPTTSAAWDEDPPAAQAFKEAPPPTLNIWQQRKEAQAAKAKAKQAPTQTPRLPNGNTGQLIINQGNKAYDASNESKKQEARKKGKPPPEEKTSAENGKAMNKDGRRRNSDDGNKNVRRRTDGSSIVEDAADKSNATVIAPPPPPGDSISWPTPENASGEEKRKPPSQQKSDEGDKEKEAPKPSGKKGWTPVPFVPTAVFTTPLPQARRGGRGPQGGGRETLIRGRNNAPSANPSEKPGISNGPVIAGQLSSIEKNAKPKRASSAGPIGGKEQRKLVDHSTSERRKDSLLEDGQPSQTKKTVSVEPKRPAVMPIPATPHIGRPFGRTMDTENDSAPTNALENYQNIDKDFQNPDSGALSNPMSVGFERKSEGSIRPSDLPKDFQGSIPILDRGEERSTRGRGGRGSRGGTNHAIYNGHLPNGNTYTNGQAYQYQPPYTAQPRSFSNHERMPSQSHGTYIGPSPPHRSYRATSRSQFNPGYVSTNGRFANGPNAGPPHLTSIQTGLANMSGYQPEAVMSAIPYASYEEQQQVTLFDMVTMQMEYYFSLDNLCKDMFLRKHMDSQGWVFLSVLAGFNRIVALTTDLELIRYVCFTSQKIELKPGQVWQDGRDRLRARDTWKSFVLNKDQRDPTAQHDGPTLAPSSVRDETKPRQEDHDGLSPRSNVSNGPVDFSYQSLNAITPSAAQHTPTNPKVNGSHSETTQPPLSAAVSEFTPSVHSHPSRRFALPDSRAHETKIFTDEDVQHLQILVRQPINSIQPPFHSASSRTFSNGSIDGKHTDEEFSEVAERQSRPVNGQVFENDRSNRSRSPFVVGSPNRRSDIERSPPVFWRKTNDESSALDSSPNELALEPYLAFRRDALREREQAPIAKTLSNMQNLYHFWSHFLIRNFNAPMYEEFKRLATEDASTRASPMGMQSLMQYYDEALLGHRTILEDNIALHYVEIVQNEDKTQDRPAFKKLRTAWRNGAFNHKNRHKILKVAGSDLVGELDR